MSVRILVFAGSCRKASFNMKLARIAHQLLRDKGAEATFIDLADYDMPIYNGDWEAANGVPAKARELKALFKSHQALAIASPENNSSVSSLLKNTLDWLSRPDGEESGLVPFKNKTALLMATSTGPFGGVRGLNHLRDCITRLGVMTLPSLITVPNAETAFTTGDDFSDVKQKNLLDRQCGELIRITAALNG